MEEKKFALLIDADNTLKSSSTSSENTAPLRIKDSTGI